MSFAFCPTDSSRPWAITPKLLGQTLTVWAAAMLFTMRVNGTENCTFVITDQLGM